MDAFMAPSYLAAKGSRLKLGGWHASVAVTLPEHRWLGLIVDVSGHFLGGDGNDDAPPPCTTPPCPQPDPAQITFMVGPRFTPFKQEHPLHMLFVHGMVFGAAHRAGAGRIGGVTSGAVALGVGYDFPITEHDTWIPRVQVDYVWPVSSDLGHGFRFSAGLVYRMH
jgi:hypothetical protein